MKKILTILFNSNVQKNIDLSLIKQNNLNTFNKIINNYTKSKSEFTNIEKFDYNALGLGRNIISLPQQIDDYLNNITNINDKNTLLIRQNYNKKAHIIISINNLSMQRNIENAFKLFNYLIANLYTKVYFHIITDKGSDNNYAINYLKIVENSIKDSNAGFISTICGSSFALDSGNNFAKTKKYYDLIINGKGVQVLELDSFLKTIYEKNDGDEMISPIIINKEGIIENGDILFWLCDNPLKSKQILEPLKNKDYKIFETKPMTDLKLFTFFNSLNSYETINLLNEPEAKYSFGNYLSKLGIVQARVTLDTSYENVIKKFDNNEEKVPHLEKYIISSLNDTYELKSVKLTKKVLTLMSQDYDFILVNFSNNISDYKGNENDFSKNYLTFDTCLNKLIESAEDNFYNVMILFNEETEMGNNIIFTILDEKLNLKNDGYIYDIVPTILDYMDISIPIEMTGKSLIDKTE